MRSDRGQRELLNPFHERAMNGRDQCGRLNPCHHRAMNGRELKGPFRRQNLKTKALINLSFHIFNPFFSAFRLAAASRFQTLIISRLSY